MSRTIPDPRIGVSPDKCPACGELLNAATNVSGKRRPKPDDRSICIHCGAFMKFGPDLRLVLLDGEETAETLRLLTTEERAAVAALAKRRAGAGGQG